MTPKRTREAVREVIKAWKEGKKNRGVKMAIYQMKLRYGISRQTFFNWVKEYA